MMLNKYLCNQGLILISLVGLLLLNNNLIYGQEDKEDAIIILSFLDENENKTITAKVSDQNGLPVEELDLYFYVQRTFSELPIGDVFNTTDENGIVIVDFPNDLPGDSEGDVTIIVKIFESDLYNDTSLEVIKNWGVPVLVDELHEQRSLWAAAANAPITLVLTTTGLILAIWLVNCYIIFVLYEISRIKPAES
jgi:hypothetical protein